MKVLFACGGTAGHINPALAIAEELLNRMPDCKILFVGADRHLDKTLIPRAGFHVVNIKMSGVRRSLSIGAIKYNVEAFKKLISADFKAAKLIKRYKPDIVVGTGGYICYPVLRQAAKMKIPTIIHESNAIPGLTTKLLSSIVDKVLVSFPNQESLYKKPEKVVFTGTPVRAGFNLAVKNEVLHKANEKPLVLSFWGSLGAEKMNEVIAEVIKLNAENNFFDHIHAVGKKSGILELETGLKQLGISDLESLPNGIKIEEYIDDMPKVMAEADLVICRGGGSTIAELMAMNKPAIIIPSPYVANNEQERNAMQLEKAGGAIILNEKQCSGTKLHKLIISLFSDKDKLKNMSENLISLSANNATKTVADIIQSLSK